MCKKFFPTIEVIALLALTSQIGCVTVKAQGDSPPPMPAQEQPEALNRGPVHEAFAEPVSLEMQAGLTAPEQPPPNIEELPPLERPQGEKFVWIPGYWAWGADQRGYVWVSACWRIAPPNMSWVPGYWASSSGGWVWVPGLWTRSGVQEIEYLPAPTVLSDMEPYGVAPSPDTHWVPPCMYWSSGRYIRRNGYWLPAQQNWVWVPSRYIATPRGYIFSEGHWDYALERRGMLFAPMYFPRSFHRRVGYAFSPSIVLDLGVLSVSLFAYPRYNHYFFGDYYDDAYLRVGIFPWFDCRSRRSWYDPLYEHARWQHQRSEPRWEQQRRSDYDLRRTNKNLRPAWTYREQEMRLAKLPEAQRRSHQITQPIAIATANRKSPIKYERITTDEQKKIATKATAVRTFRDDRSRWEEKNGSTKATLSTQERKQTVTTPTVRPATPQAPQARKPTVTTPTVRPATPQAPQARKTFVLPSAQQEPTPRTSVTRSERITIPDSPVQASKPGFFQRSPPSRPAAESRDQEGRDIRGSRSSNR